MKQNLTPNKSVMALESSQIQAIALGEIGAIRKRLVVFVVGNTPRRQVFAQTQHKNDDDSYIMVLGAAVMMMHGHHQKPVFHW